eukprot:TRINITY_DN5430_c0_g1_i1.p1 TRINITY_DN5430_c0_g1~~TRINITY_DN5430_c0_g1_i1.p1  ORF type:complete len:129 (+),score=36.08 TRINITY_DN5430_c0_g1_i1:228-614(+)
MTNVAVNGQWVFMAIGIEFEGSSHVDAFPESTIEFQIRSLLTGALSSMYGPVGSAMMQMSLLKYEKISNSQVEVIIIASSKFTLEVRNAFALSGRANNRKCRFDIHHSSHSLVDVSLMQVTKAMSRVC